MITDPRVQCVLAACGWFPGRHVSINDWISRLCNEGFQFSVESSSILEEFGGLLVSPPHSAENVYAPTSIFFDPIEGASGEFDRIAEWQSKLGMTLSPVGGVFDTGILLVGEDGRVFADCDDKLYFLGESFDSALTTLVLASAQPREIAPPKWQEP